MKAGDRIKLLGIPEEGIPEEIGTVINPDVGGECYLVEVDKEYRDGKWDDGLRETDYDFEILK